MGLTEIMKLAGSGDAYEGADSAALEARGRFDRIFRACSRFGGTGPEEWWEAREHTLRPLMESFRTWAMSDIGGAAPELGLHMALSYAFKYWPYAMSVLEDGRLGLDNNIVTRSSCLS